MEFLELLKIGRDLKKYNCSCIRKYLEMLQTFDNTQENVFNILMSNDVDIERAIEGIYEEQYCIYDNFIDYIDNYVSNQCNLPDFIELNYTAMWYRTFRYDDNIYIDWQEWEWCKNRDEYGTQEQKEQQKEYIKYNIEYSQLIKFFY